MFFLSLIFGFAFLSIMAVTVEISVATLFVCFAEDPDALRLAQPRLHAKMLKEWKRRFKFLPEFLGRVREDEEETERLEKKGWGWWGRKK